MTSPHSRAAAPPQEPPPNTKNAEASERNSDSANTTAEPSYSVVTAPHRDSRTWTAGELTFTEFANWAEDPADRKECGNYLFGRLRGDRRTNAAILSRSAVTLDYDHPPAGAWARAAALGVLAVVHETFSSTPDARRFRVIVPLDREVTPDEYPRVAGAVAARIGTEGLDPKSYQPEQYMFRPAVPAERRAEWAPVIVDDQPVSSADDLLAEMPEPPRLARIARDASKRSPFDLPGPVGAFNRAYGFEDVIEEYGIPYGAAGSGRWHLAGASGAPGVIEIADGLVYSHHAGDPAYGRALSAFDLARVHLYGDLDDDAPEGTPVDRLPSTLAMMARVQDDPRVVEQVVEDFEELPVEAGPYAAVFGASEVLSGIHDAAHARMVSAPGLLLYVLGRVLAEVPPSVKLPPVVGSAAALNLGVAVVAESGGGKSALMEVSREVLGLIGVDQEQIERAPGSGEGMVETYLQTVGRGKAARKELIDDPRRIMAVDEIGQLGAVQGRNGATVSHTIRTMLTGGMAGQENAAAETRRLLPGGTYRMVLFAGVQPTRSDVLLADADAGTPQRFVWVPADDDTVPPPDQMPAWPGSLDWELPRLGAFIDYPDDIKEQVLRDRWLQMRGKDSTGLSGHLNLTRLKVSAALALLHGEAAIDARWWELAGVIVDESMRLQEKCRAALSAAATNSARARGRLDGVRAEGAAQVRDERLTRAAQALARTVRIHARDGDAPNRKHAPDAGCTRRCVTYALKRRADLRDEAVAMALDEDWIRHQDERFIPGGSQPAGDP